MGWHVGCSAGGGDGTFCSTPAGRCWTVAVTAPYLLLPPPGSFLSLSSRRTVCGKGTKAKGDSPKWELMKFSSESNSCVQGEMKKGQAPSGLLSALLYSGGGCSRGLWVTPARQQRKLLDPGCGTALCCRTPELQVCFSAPQCDMSDRDTEDLQKTCLCFPSV